MKNSTEAAGIKGFIPVCTIWKMTQPTGDTMIMANIAAKFTGFKLSLLEAMVRLF